MKENTTTYKDEIISFSQPKSYLFFTNHVEKIFYLLLIIAILFNLENMEGQFLIDVFVLITCLCFILFLFVKFLKKFSWRFDLNFNQKKIYFYMCRESDVKVIDFDAINEISVAGPITFSLNNRKIYYSTSEYLKVLSTLKRIKNIRWGMMCDLLGPDKETREKIESWSKESNFD